MEGAPDNCIVRVFDGHGSLHFGPLPRYRANELRDAIRAANPGPSVTVRRLLEPAVASEVGEGMHLLLSAAES